MFRREILRGLDIKKLHTYLFYDASFGLLYSYTGYFHEVKFIMMLHFFYLPRYIVIA